MKSELPHLVTIACTKMSEWDPIVMSVVGLFGADPTRWRSRSTFDDMTFSFADERDALLFRLKYSQLVINHANRYQTA